MASETVTLAPYKTLTLDELLALQLPELEWVVDGILPLGSFTMLAAREKAGKSLLTVDLCCSIALGEPFLDREVRQGRALLIPAEENIRDVRSRIVSRLDGRTDADLFVLPGNGFTEDELRIDQGDSLGRLMATIQEIKPLVIVMDPMRELHNLSENDADAMGPMLRPVRQIAHSMNVALVMNHHMSRLGNSRGSTAIRASVDQEWAFRRTDDETAWAQAPSEGTLRVEGRFGARQQIGIRLTDKLRWQPAEITIGGAERNMRTRIFDLLVNVPDGLTADTIAEQLEANKKTIQNAISQMLREPRPVIIPAGRGVTGDPRRFCAKDPFLIDEETVPYVPGNNGKSLNGHHQAVYFCVGCGHPRSRDRLPCPTCGATKGEER